MKKRIILLALISACTAFALYGCGENKKTAETNDLKETVSEEQNENTEDTERFTEKTEDSTEEMQDIVNLEKGENEFTDAVYEYAKELDVMKEGEFASYRVDFDDDGNDEAFVLRGHQDDEDDTRWYSSTVWFVNENLEVEQLFGWYDPNITYYTEEEFKDIDGGKCFYLSGYNTFDKSPFCYMYMLKDGLLEDVTEDINGENEPFEAKYTQEELNAMSPQELFEAFCKGEVQAEFADIDGKTGYIDTRDWGWSEDDMNDYQKVIEPYDVDNDGELEYIIETMYGIMCFDCKDGKVTMFADGEGTAAFARYITYNNATWVVYQDTSHEGRSTYQLYKYNGDLQIEDSMNLYWNEEEDGNRIYYYNDEEISEDKYNTIYKDIFGE